MRSLWRVCFLGTMLLALFGNSLAAHGQTRFRGRWGPYDSFNGAWHDYDQQWSGGLAFSPDSTFLLRHDDQKLVLWQLDERREVAALEPDGLPRLCRFSPDGRWLAAARRIPSSPEYEAFLWELKHDTPAEVPAVAREGGR